MNRHTLLTSLAIVLLVLSTPLVAQEQEPASIEVPFYMPTPEGWRTETISFPLGFAPEIEYEGFEELRFAPGMFDETKEDYWTYAFVWWIPAGAKLNAETLTRDLPVYFRGLANAVAESRGFEVGDADFTAAIKATEDGFRGKANAFDVFATREPVVLNLIVDVINCGEQGQTAAFFQLSPQSTEHDVWHELAEIRLGFLCKSRPTHDH